MAHGVGLALVCETGKVTVPQNLTSESFVDVSEVYLLLDMIHGVGLALVGYAKWAR